MQPGMGRHRFSLDIDSAIIITYILPMNMKNIPRKTVKQAFAATLLSLMLSTPILADDSEWGDFADEATGNSSKAETEQVTAEINQSGSVMNTARKYVVTPELMASSAFLWTEKDAKGYILPGNGTVVKPKDKAAFQLYDNVQVSPVGKSNYKLGDTVDFISSIRLVSFKGKTANLVKRCGKGIVEGHSGKGLEVGIIQMWGVIKGGERIVSAEKFQEISADSLAAPEKNIQAKVVTRVDETGAPYLHQMFIIDKGSDDGVRLGDYFTVFEKKTDDSTSKELLVAQVINTASKSSTLVILKLNQSHLEKGDEAFLSLRLVQK